MSFQKDLYLPQSLLLVVDVASLPFGPLFSCGAEVLFRTACCLTEELQVEASHMETVQSAGVYFLFLY